jgi:hypothetical protein
MSSVFKRYDMQVPYYEEVDAEGTWVLAQDAYDKVAVLEAEIQTLKSQLKDARKDAASYKPAGAGGNGQILYTKHN